MFPLLIQQDNFKKKGLTLRVVGFSLLERGCEHFSLHAPWFCLSVSVTNMLSYTQYHCHSLPGAFLAPSAGAGNSAPPAHLWVICRAQFHRGTRLPLRWQAEELMCVCVTFVGGLRVLFRPVGPCFTYIRLKAQYRDQHSHSRVKEYCVSQPSEMLLVFWSIRKTELGKIQLKTVIIIIIIMIKVILLKVPCSAYFQILMFASWTPVEQHD